MTGRTVPHAWLTRSASLLLTFVVVAGALAFALS